MTRGLQRHTHALRAISLTLFLSGGFATVLWTFACASAGEKTSPKGDEKGKRDKEFENRIADLVKACESLESQRITAFYTKDAYIHFLALKPLTHVGIEEHKGTVTRMVDEAREVRITLVEDELQVWKGKKKSWTLQPFTISATLKDGRWETWTGRHSAMWEKVDDKWLVAYEHLLGPAPTPTPVPGTKNEPKAGPK